MSSSLSNSKNELIRGAASLSLAALLVKVLGVAYKIPLSHILGDDGMGFFNTAYTVYTFFFLICSAGVPKAITILVTENSTKGSEVSDAILKTARRAFFTLGVVIAGLFAVSAFPIASFIGSSRSAIAMLAISPAIPFITAAAVYRGYLNGKLRFGTVAISQLIEAAIKLVLGLAFSSIAIRLGATTEFIAAAAIFGITIGSFITYMYLIISTKIKKAAKTTRQNELFDQHILKKMLKISLPITLSSGTMSLVNIIDLTVIIRGLEKNGYTEDLSTMLYGNYTTLAVPMFNFVLSVISSICISALPILTELATNKKNSEFCKSLTYSAELVAFFALPATALFAFFSREILIILFDYSSVALGDALLSILSPSVTLIALLTLVNTALEAKGGYIVPLISMGIGGIAKIITSSLLVGRASFAIWGAPIGTSISYLVSILVSIVLYQSRIGRIFSIIRGFLLSAICAVVSIVPILAIKNYFLYGKESVISSLILLSFYGVIYLLLSFLLGSLPINRSEITAK